MATEVIEQPDSRAITGGGTNANIRYHYKVQGTSSRTTAYAAVEAEAPADLDSGDFVRSTIRCEPEFVDTADDRGVWDVEVMYKLPGDDQPAVGESRYSFDTGGGSQHITQSIATSQKVAASGTAPDQKGAIGKNGDNIEGCDIVVPVFNFSETHYIADATVDAAYKAAIFAATGKTNDASFKGLAKGECLFLGAAGSQRGDDDWEITFRFAGSPNKTGLTIGDVTGVNKEGWEYLWVLYEEEYDGTAKADVRVPTAVYVEQVYDEADFSTLGIGT